MRLIADKKLDFNDVLIVPKRSSINSRNLVSLVREFKFKHSKQIWNGCPIVASNMDTTGTFEIAHVIQEMGLLTSIQKHYTYEDWAVQLDSHVLMKDYIIPTLNDHAQYHILYQSGIRWLCLDVANGYTEQFSNIVRDCRLRYSDAIIVAGNVVTPEMTEALILAGADVVKVGIGNGAACTTRIKTGVGYPQFSAIMECADAAHGLGGHVMSDGGCVVVGDIAKAFGAGADFVMLGSMFAAHEESGGDTIEKDGKRFKQFYGMSSEFAMNKYLNTADYRTSEGRETLIEIKGSLVDTVTDIFGGLRSACTYVGASTLKELPKRATFIKVNHQFNNSLEN